MSNGGRFRRQDDVIRGRALINSSLLSMYRIVAKQLYPWIVDKRMILEIKDSSKLMLAYKVVNTEMVWFEENVYTYELIVPIADTGRLYHFMLEDLNRYSNYKGQLEKRKVRCFVLVKQSGADKILAKSVKAENRLLAEKPYVKNLRLSTVITSLNSLVKTPYPIVDETNYTGNVDIEFNSPIIDVNSLRKGLQQHGLDLIEVERELEMFVISDKNK